MRSRDDILKSIKRDLVGMFDREVVKLESIKEHLSDYYSDLKLSNPYHSSGIGNNNEFEIYREVPTAIEGITVYCKEIIGYLYYTYGVYGGSCYYGLKDSDKIVVYKNEAKYEKRGY